MTDWILLVLAAGLANGVLTTIIVESAISDPVRHFLFRKAGIYKSPWDSPAAWLCELLSCPLCTSFWLGLGLGAGVMWIGYGDVDVILRLFLWSLAALSSAAIGLGWRRYCWT